jgi:hypothetical protein
MLYRNKSRDTIPIARINSNSGSVVLFAIKPFLGVFALAASAERLVSGLSNNIYTKSK